MHPTLEKFCRLFQVPEFIAPWLDRFIQPTEIDLVLHLAAKPLTAAEITRKLDTLKKINSIEDLQGFLERCCKRGIIHQLENGCYHAADFHTRYDVWALFEGWKDIPDDIRQQLNQWELAYYEDRHIAQISILKAGHSKDPADTWPEYLLLHEAEALIDRVAQIYLWPCNCRSMVGECRQSVYTCLRFDNDSGIGWQISKSRAKEIMHAANKKGLMQSGEVAISADGSITGAVCNCCADCCFPHLLAARQNAEKLWPLSRYVARHLRERCISCGRCAKRCPFGAFKAIKRQKESGPKSKKLEIKYDRDLCRGCGICSTGCPEEAIEMEPLEVDSLVMRILEK